MATAPMSARQNVLHYYFGARRFARAVSRRRAWWYASWQKAN